MQITNQQRKLIAVEARKELARRNYLDYCEYVHRGKWRPYAVHRLLCEKLESVLRGVTKRLIISMPPRHGKSQTVSETFPSYYISKYPDKKVILTSRDDTLAGRFGLYNRRKVEEFGKELFGIELQRGSSSSTNWSVMGHSGYVLSAPIMGGIVGSGANLLIVDDPIKNRQEAESALMREKIWKEWLDSLLTRLEGDAAVILIMTRWHEDDIAGRLIKQGGWDILCLPAECESENDPLGRNIGDPLCPELGKGSKWLSQTKREVGSRTWNALYQGRPSPEEGGIIKRAWIKRYETLPEKVDEWTQSWDLSFKGNGGSDFVAGGVWARKGADHYLVGIVKERLDFTATIAKIRRITDAYPQAVAKLIEDKANGPAVIASLRQQIQGIIPITPHDSKEGRAQAVTPLFEAGNVYVPFGVAGDDYIEELVAFPNGANDDQVDQTTQYLARHLVRKDKPRVCAIF
ncbi:MAG: phage terminase large subunit [Ruminococcus flavefaciens]|nr:phage terminase large subunit [Ruminococcus flavefaciens]